MSGGAITEAETKDLGRAMTDFLLRRVLGIEEIDEITPEVENRLKIIIDGAINNAKLTVSLTDGTVQSINSIVIEAVSSMPAQPTLGQIEQSIRNCFVEFVVPQVSVVNDIQDKLKCIEYISQNIADCQEKITSLQEKIVNFEDNRPKPVSAEDVAALHDQIKNLSIAIKDIKASLPTAAPMQDVSIQAAGQPHDFLTIPPFANASQAPPPPLQGDEGAGPQHDRDGGARPVVGEPVNLLTKIRGPRTRLVKLLAATAIAAMVAVQTYFTFNHDMKKPAIPATGKDAHKTSAHADILKTILDKPTSSGGSTVRARACPLSPNTCEINQMTVPGYAMQAAINMMIEKNILKLPLLSITGSTDEATIADIRLLWKDLPSRDTWISDFLPVLVKQIAKYDAIGQGWKVILDTPTTNSANITVRAKVCPSTGACNISGISQPTFAVQAAINILIKEKIIDGESISVDGSSGQGTSKAKAAAVEALKPSSADDARFLEEAARRIGEAAWRIEGKSAPTDIDYGWQQLLETKIGGQSLKDKICPGMKDCGIDDGFNKEPIVPVAIRAMSDRGMIPSDAPSLSTAVAAFNSRYKAAAYMPTEWEKLVIQAAIEKLKDPSP